MINIVPNKNKVVLDGKWHFSLDPNDNQNWNKATLELPKDMIKVPGSIEEQGYGTYSSHQPIGTWKKDREYEGVAWYLKDVLVPNSYDGKRIYLNIKGVRWFTELWIDGKFVSKGDSVSSPHRFDITSFVNAGEEHLFSIRVDNRMALSLGESHIHSYHTSTYWGGITGGIDLEACLPNSLEKVQIISDIVQKSVNVNIKINKSDYSDIKNWELFAEILGSKDTVVTSKIIKLNDTSTDEINSILSFVLQLGEDAELWSPVNPYLYKLKLTLRYKDEVHEQKEIVFGLRTIKTEGNQLLLNNQSVFLTGYVDCCIFPQTGYPVWDIGHYKKQFKIVKDLGFNHVRLHGWNPPEPFWQAADEEGMLVQTELPHWSEHYIDRQVDASKEVQDFMKQELERIIFNLHTHPSFVMLSMGNELISVEGHGQLNKLVQYARELDPTRLYTDNTGFGELPANDREGDFYIPTLNWHPPYHIDDSANPNTSLDYGEVTRLENKPLIAHEHGQFTMYVRPEESKKYKGVLKPDFLKPIKETLEVKGLEDRVDEFIEATGVHLVRSLKETMEKARRTPNLAGIQLLDIRDFPGQGHATVGVLDVFWDSKDVIKPEEFRQFNEQTVLLMRTEKRTYYSNENLSAKIEVSHFGQQFETGKLKWVLKSGDEIIDEASKTFEDIPGNGLTDLLQIQVPISEGTARELVLIVELDCGGEVFKNQWGFWTFSRQTFPKGNDRIWTDIAPLRSILYGARFEQTIGIKQHSFVGEKNVDLAITNRMSRDVLQYLIDGGSVWMMADENNQHDEVLTRYLPTFWNYLWFPEQKGTTMGMINHSHPALKGFPNDGFSDWQWYHLVNNTVALSLDLIPKVKPIVEVIDNFNRAKRLAYAFEVKVGKGKLFVSTFNFTNKKTMNLPEVHYLFFELFNYLKSNDFQPNISLSVGELLGIFKVKSPFNHF